MSGTLVVFGSGPGIGNHVALEFAQHSFSHVILLARNESRLSTDKEFIQSSAPSTKVDSLRLDLSDLSSIPSVLKQIDSLAPKVDVLFFNAARINASDVLTTPVEEIDEDLKVTTLALYIIAQHYLPKLTSFPSKSPSSKPALLVTNSHLPYSPVPQLLSLSIAKAAQRNLVQNLKLTFADSGVFIGLVTVEGVVAPEEKSLNPKNIAKQTWGFYEKGGDVLEVKPGLIEG
ncbi:hypothetical protein BCR34DRAFT_671791 [Clohesyomyces aquaticus]|uniref:Uncharacterized protein n=1 Tax=Clohesyomyces aquaticus TaxID=1231657 RepID=A0A1Y2A0P5_9PLEO|nr:hypothetical protein BCR34DRAFT_671791 [Clohesyomyces aquaticus]